MPRKEEKIFSSLLGAQGYFRQSRYLSFALITLSPLWILYELLALQAGRHHHAILRNKADVLLKYPVLEFGAAGWIILALPILLCLIYIYRHEWGRVRITVPFFFYPIIEGATYASVMGLLIHRLIGALSLAAPTLQGTSNPVMLAMGAGVYEELLFRGLLYWLPVHLILLRWREHPIYIYLLMAVTSSFLFTLFHYDVFFIRWDYAAVFRLIAGLFYCLLCSVRGLSVAVWSHFLYDFFLIF
ncbi:MAG TPA: CPBP family intramembrane metalloprotease [bacterium]|nr:CPBP family intramembrane metalloprotease [bacterium]HPN32960.1 CPBP family intramembrane metalloprotease [bacterium]